jgi:capsular polysaccharide biosynthesis protein
VTLLLAHDPTTQADAAMETDVSMLKTRAVAQKLGRELGLDVPPDVLLASIHTQATTSSVLQVNIAGTDPDDAVRRARLLGETYLSYRKQQFTQQAEDVAGTYQKRIDALQLQVDDLTRQYDAITARGGGGDQAGAVLASRGQLISDIAGLESQIETVSLQANAIVAASRVIDQPSLVPQSPRRRAVLSVGSGVIGGLGLGLGIVMVYAITTGRLRSRADIATATGLPVMFSAGEVVPARRRPGSRHEAALNLLVDGLETAMPRSGNRPRRLGLITVDCEREGAKVVAGLARRLSVGESVLAVDLAATGLLAGELESPASEAEEGHRASVPVVPGPSVDTVADVVLGFVPFEIGRGLGHVRSTASEWVLLTKAGRSTSERLNTASRAARAAGLDVEFVMLVGADESDASFGGEGAVAKAEQAP